MLLLHSTLRKQPKLNIPFEKILGNVLGKKYELSLVLCADKLMKRLSLEYKNNPNHKNVLAFPISEHSGEIFINLQQAKKEAPSFGHSFKEHVLFLYIHALLHLKGLDHSPEMEKKEQKLLKQYSR